MSLTSSTSERPFWLAQRDSLWRPQLDSLRTKAYLATTRLATADPIGALAEKKKAYAENGIAPLVVFLVLIAFLALLAAAISVAVLIFCSQRGMNFVWWIKTSWFEIKVACRK